MELLEKIAVAIAFGDEDFDCPFPHKPKDHKLKNKIPPENANNATTLAGNLKGETHHVTLVTINPPLELSTGAEHAKFGFSAHHLIPGNEIWNDKGHPLHDWIHKDKGKVKGDIGYENNAATNGVDLPSSKRFKDGGTPWSATVGPDQLSYSYAAMAADTKMRQFHDAHKAYSDMVWNALVKISEKLDDLEEKKGCGNKNCPLNRSKPYEPPYFLRERLIGVADRLRMKLWGDPKKWQAPLFTSRFALMYKIQGKDQEKARQKLSNLRDKMGRPTD